MDSELLPLLSFFRSLEHTCTVTRTEVSARGDGVSALIELSLLPSAETDVEASDDLLVALEERSRRFGKPRSLLVNVQLPRGFPATPPEIRVIEPVFVTGTGGIINGNVLLPCLWPEGWRREGGFPLCDVLAWVRDHVLASGALLDRDSNHYYNAAAHAATRAKLRKRPDLSIRHPATFSRRLCVYGSLFATTVLGLSLPDGFDAGNKVLLPSVCLAQLAQSELQALRSDADTEPAAGQTPAEGKAAAQRRVLERLRNGDASEDDFMDGSALTFELVSVLRFPVYVGVAAFTVPHSDALVVPIQVLQSLGIPEGSEVTLSRVALPPAQSLVLQPLTVNFEAVEAFTDRPPREYLEASLTRFGCLQAGDVIMCDGGPAQAGGVPHEFWFNVIATKPAEAAAVALWSKFHAQLPIEFVPAADSFVEDVPKPAPPPLPAPQAPAAAPQSLVAEAPTLRPPLPTQTAFSGVGRTLASSEAVAAPVHSRTTPAAAMRLPVLQPPLESAASVSSAQASVSPTRGVLGAAAAAALVGASSPRVLPAVGIAATSAPLAAAMPPSSAAGNTGAGPALDDREERRRRAAAAALRRTQQLEPPAPASTPEAGGSAPSAGWSEC